MWPIEANLETFYVTYTCDVYIKKKTNFWNRIKHLFRLVQLYFTNLPLINNYHKTKLQI
jgi:hypothetical protein